MRIVFFFILFFTCLVGQSQCYELLENRLEQTGEIPYSMVDKLVLDVKSGRTISIKVRNVEYKTKLGFIFQSTNIGDTLDVSLITLNRKVLARKKITKDDDFLRYDPFRKSENYFLIVETKAVIDTSNKKPLTGCLGIAVLERVKRKALKKVQKIEWKRE
jgi:hypothetical protein